MFNIDMIIFSRPPHRSASWRRQVAPRRGQLVQGRAMALSTWPLNQCLLADDNYWCYWYYIPISYDIICIYMYWCFSRLPTCFCWYKCSTFINFPNLLAIYDELRPQIYLFIDNTGTGAAPLGHPGELGAYPLAMTNSLLWYRWPIYRWFTHCKWWFLIVMLVYQRVRPLL